MIRTTLLSALLVGAALGCSSKPAAEPAPAPPTRASARSAWVQPKPARGVSLTEAPARVLPPPEGAAALSAPFPASVTRVAVRPGQTVKRGEVLVEVLMPEVVRAAGQYQAASLRREAYARRKEQLHALKEQGMARLSEQSEAETQLAEAQAEQQAALAVLRVAGLDGAAAAGVASRGTVALRSPVDGVVTEVHAALGEMRESGSEPLVRVVGGGEARIEARMAQALPEAAGFEFVSAGSEPLPVRMVGRAPAVDPGDGTTAMWFEPEPPRALPAGLQGTVRVRADGLPGVTVVPSRALVLEAGKAEVLVRAGEGYQRREVRVVSTSGADALVRGGFAEGDVVAADAAAVLAEGGGEP